MLPVSMEVRKHAGVTGGDEVTVELELDTEPRTVTVPADLASALSMSKNAKTFFEEKLSYSNRRWYVLWLESAKKKETRARRLATLIDDSAHARRLGVVTLKPSTSS